VGFTFLQKKKSEKNENNGFTKCFKQEKRKENFTLFGHLQDGRQKFFKYFRMSSSKFENLEQLLHTDIEKKNKRWRWSIRTEERLALTLRLVHKNV
jgi:hypothetical protein